MSDKTGPERQPACRAEMVARLIAPFAWAGDGPRQRGGRRRALEKAQRILAALEEAERRRPEAERILAALDGEPRP
jgi:hypothetical protein